MRKNKQRARGGGTGALAWTNWKSELSGRRELRYLHGMQWEGSRGLKRKFVLTGGRWADRVAEG